MTKEELINAGYTRYEPLPFEECQTDLYQKLIRDDNGNKKYFINIYVWDFSKYEQPGRKSDNPHFEVQTQLRHKKTGQHLEIALFDGWSVEDTEKFLEDVFNLGWFCNYENSEYYKEEDG